MPGENLELIEAIVRNDDNMTCGSIISVYTGPDESIAALINVGIEALTGMLADARPSSKKWSSFLNAFVADPDTIAGVNEKRPR
jgi:hypothetical protein